MLNNAFRKEPDAGKPHVRFLGGAHLVKGASTRPGKNGELLEVDTRDKKDLFKAISGQLEIVGLSTANDEHLFMMINNNPNIRSVVYYYLKDDDKIELPHHIKKPTTFKKVTKLWYSMK